MPEQENSFRAFEETAKSDFLSNWGAIEFGFSRNTIISSPDGESATDGQDDSWPPPPDRIFFRMRWIGI